MIVAPEHTPTTETVPDTVKTLAPDIIEDLEDWEQKRRAYEASLTQIYESTATKFDQLFEDYFDKLRETIKSLDMPRDVQMEVIRKEYMRVETAKRQLFTITGQELLDEKISAKKDEAMVCICMKHNSQRR